MENGEGRLQLTSNPVALTDQRHKVVRRLLKSFWGDGWIQTQRGLEVRFYADVTVLREDVIAVHPLVAGRTLPAGPTVHFKAEMRENMAVKVLVGDAFPGPLRIFGSQLGSHLLRDCHPALPSDLRKHFETGLGLHGLVV